MNAEKYEAINEQLNEIFDNTPIVDRHDLESVAFAMIAHLTWSIAQTYPSDRPTQLRAANDLARYLREAIEHADPDASAQQ